jgi:hypothetical protein
MECALTSRCALDSIFSIADLYLRSILRLRDLTCQSQRNQRERKHQRGYQRDCRLAQQPLRLAFGAKPVNRGFDSL